jgi:hypothetical protein
MIDIVINFVENHFNFISLSQLIDLDDIDIDIDRVLNMYTLYN